MFTNKTIFKNSEFPPLYVFNQPCSHVNFLNIWNQSFLFQETICRSIETERSLSYYLSITGGEEID